MTDPLDIEQGDASETADFTGSVLEGRYRVLEKLGAGGMGTVYRAEHVMLGSEVAIKVLKPQFSYDPEWAKRFLFEARAASRIRHPNIVQMLDFAAPRRGLVYMVMELLEGESLADLARREGHLPWPRIAHITEQVADALAAAHAHGIIHRDIKPGNCFRSPTRGDPDFIKVLDFGIAKLLGGNEGDGDMPSTATGLFMGTPEYTAPEIFHGAQPTPRADVYAVGVLMYKLLTGRVPFAGAYFAVAHQLMMRDAPPPSQMAPLGVAVAPHIDTLILRALHKDPAARIATMGELRSALRATLDAPAIVPTIASAVQPAPEPEPLATEPATLEHRRIPKSPVASASSSAEHAIAPSEPTIVPEPPEPRGRAASSIFRLVTIFAVAAGIFTVLLVVAIKLTEREAPTAPRTEPLAPGSKPATAKEPALNAAHQPQHLAGPPPTSEPPAPDQRPDGPPIRASSAESPVAPPPNPKPDPRPRPPLPAALAEATIHKQLDKLKSVVQSDCFAPANAFAGTEVALDIDVSPEGVLNVKSSKPLSIAFVDCIVKRVGALRFSKTQNGGAGKYAFVARAP